MGLVSALRKAVKASSLVDGDLARDFDQALAMGRNTGARLKLMREPKDVEHGVFARDTGIGEIGTSGSDVQILPEDIPGVPYGRGPIDFHHTHPLAPKFADMGYVQPLSVEDLIAVAHLKNQNPRMPMRGMFAHETAGKGGSYAAPGKRGKHKGYEDALGSGFQAATGHLDGSLSDAGKPLADHYALLATGMAAKRRGLLSKYGYRPSRDAQAEVMAALDMDKAESAAWRAMHQPIYGLPYPFSYGGLGLGAAALGAGGLAYGALR